MLFNEMNMFRGYNIKRIGVFGSFARGEHFNDIDLFIEDELNFQELIQLKNLLERRQGYRSILCRRNMQNRLYSTGH